MNIVFVDFPIRECTRRKLQKGPFLQPGPRDQVRLPSFARRTADGGCPHMSIAMQAKEKPRLRRGFVGQECPTHMI